MSKIDNSIIIVNWNTREMLDNCISSIFDKAKTTTYEIIVVDNGSTDDSVKMLKAKYPHVILIEAGENLGFSKANNRGIDMAIGRYITLLNSDTYLINSALDIMVEYMDKNKHVGLLGGKLFNSDMSVQSSCREFPTLWRSYLKLIFPNSIRKYISGFSNKNISRFNYKETKEVEVLIGALIMTRKSALDEVGKLDESFFFYGEDIDWSKRYWEKNWKVIFYPKAEIVHLGGGSSKVAPVKYRIEMMKADLVYISKYYHGISFFVFYLNTIFFHLNRYLLMSFIKKLSIRQDGFTTYFIEREKSCLNWLLKNNFNKRPILDDNN